MLYMMLLQLYYDRLCTHLSAVHIFFYLVPLSRIARFSLLSTVHDMSTYIKNYDQYSGEFHVLTRLYANVY